MSDIGFGIIGQGVGWSRTNMVMEAEGARLAAVCDLLEDRRERAKTEFGCPVYEDYREMLERDDIDVIGIFTPAGNRREIALDAFDAGKHVICTKPMEINIARCDDMINAADKAGLTLSVDFQFRYGDFMRATKKAVDEGLFGRLTLGKAELKWYRNQEYYDWNGGWRGTWRWDGGGALANQSVHYVDLLQWLMGPPESVSAYAGVHKMDIEAEDQTVAVVKWKNGAVGLLMGATTAVPGIEMNTVEVLGTKGNAVSLSDSGSYEAGIDGGPGRGHTEAWFLVDENGERTTQTEWDIPEAPTNIIEDVVSMLLHGTKPMADGREGRKSIEILNAVYESSQTGETVKFPLEKPFIPKDGYTR